jgi:diguanylate cyclase (GGDEF)-like protein
MHADRRVPVALLAVLYACCGAFALIAAVWPPNSHSPVALDIATAVVGLGGAVGCWALGGRTSWTGIHASIALAGGVLAVLAWHAATAAGIVGLGPVLIAIGLYAAYFFSLTAARLHVVALVVLTTAGAIGARPSHFTVPWVVLVLATLGLTETQGRLARSLRTAATTDPLTGVANRRAWEAEAARNLAHAHRTGEPLSFAILDLDSFKVVNDREGHGAGDALLIELTAGWSRRLRAADLLGRYGGDEFVLSLPGTDEAGAWQVLHQLDETHDFPWSAGVATVGPDDTLASVLARADGNLYQQKRSGRRA